MSQQHSNADDVPLRDLDPYFEGGVPASLCTCGRDGTPNISFLSVVYRVDERHVALSFQYFRKTKANIAENPRAQLIVVEPSTAAEYSLDLSFIRTESDGPIFDRLSSNLAALATQTGMEEVFELRGADIYEVTSCRRTDNGVVSRLPTQSLERLSGLCRCTDALSQCSNMDELVQAALDGLDVHLGYRHSFIVAMDESDKTLFSVASRGHSPSGVGAEVRLGEGLVGVAAASRMAMRTANLSRERTFANTVRDQLEGNDAQHRDIPQPGLAGAESQLAVPITAADELLGVLCLQSARPAAFTRVDEEIVSVVAAQLAVGMARFAASGEGQASLEKNAARSPTTSEARIRYYAEDDSIFVDDSYLIKGIAGRILWLLVRNYTADGRTEFTNRELRLDASLGLPPIKDNLETRLIMLRKRLEERCAFLRIRRTGRGRFAIDVDRVLRLEQDV